MKTVSPRIALILVIGSIPLISLAQQAMVIPAEQPIISPAQLELTLRFYDTSDGLLSDAVESVAVDNHGFIWTSHFSALSRFDGYEFTTFQYDADNASRKNLKAPLFTVLADANGEILLIEMKQDPTMRRTILKYDWKTDCFNKYQFDLKGQRMIRIRVEKNRKAIWIGSTDGIFYLNSFEGTPINYKNPDSTLGNNTILDIKYYSTKLLLATGNGLWIFDTTSHHFSRPVCAPQDTALLYHTSILTIMDDPRISNGLWLKLNKGSRLGTGLMKIDSTFTILRRIDLPNNMQMQFYAWDDNEVLWFTNMTNNNRGVIRFDILNNSLTIVDKVERSPSAPNIVTNLEVDRHGNLWVATESGLTCVPRRTLNFSNKSVPNLDFASTVYQSAKSEYLITSQYREDNIKNILVASLQKGEAGDLEFTRLNTDVVQGFGAVATFWRGKNFLWVAVAGEGGRIVGLPINQQTQMFEASNTLTFLNDLSNSNTIGSFMCNAVWEDESKNLWVGHYTGGLFTTGLSNVVTNVKYGEPGSVQRFSRIPADSNSLIDNNVRSFFPHEASLWVMTDAGADLLHFEKDGDPTFEHVLDSDHVANGFFKSKDGSLFYGDGTGLNLLERGAEGWIKTRVLEVPTGVGSMQEDDKGRIWFLGEGSLFCLDRSNKSAVKFSKHDGLLQLPGIQFSCLLHHTRDGRMIIQGSSGLTVFDPLSFEFERRAVIPLIVGIKVNNHEPVIGGKSTHKDDFVLSESIMSRKSLVIDYLHNNFSLTFTALEMTAPEKNRYRHKLDGYDEDWIETDYKNRTATYTDLPSGTYTFRVKASNHHGVWSDQEKTLKVIILPPPWRTWWAYSLYSLFALGLLFAARKNIVQRERLKSNLQLAKVEQEKEHFELEKAKEVDRVKTSFFTNISHEFRTPLTLIKGPVQDVLERYKDDPKLQQQLKLVERNSDLLLKLINQLLDLAKLDAGSLKVEKSKGEVMRFVKATGSSFTSLAAQKNISITIDVPPEPCYALFDRDKLETILINLINNAIKFTPPHGKVSISADVKNNSLRFTVRDTGIGIPEEQREKIFERFHQVSESHKEVGTGIGLALAKELVSLLGGAIAVKSEVGKGSEFIVTLPLEIVSAEEHIEAHEQEPSINQPTVHVIQNKIALENATSNGGERRSHILVVEDNADLRSFIIESLGEEFHFLEAENGKQGLDVATTEIPDLIISDVMMPEMDGITMAEKIKGDIRTSHIPLILLTAKSTEASKLTGLESGADDYLTKPFNKHELLLKIRNGISRQRKLREKVMAELMSEAPRKEVLSADEQFLTKVKDEILKQMSNEQLSVEFLAEQIGMSRVHLYRKLSGLTGMSVNELIRKLRLHRAAQLLQQQWGPVSQVAYEVGFSNLSYFSKVFKEEFDKLPSEYSDSK